MHARTYHTRTHAHAHACTHTPHTHTHTHTHADIHTQPQTHARKTHAHAHTHTHTRTGTWVVSTHPRGTQTNPTREETRTGRAYILARRRPRPAPCGAHDLEKRLVRFGHPEPLNEDKRAPATIAGAACRVGSLQAEVRTPARVRVVLGVRCPRCLQHQEEQPPWPVMHTHTPRCAAPASRRTPSRDHSRPPAAAPHRVPAWLGAPLVVVPITGGFASRSRERPLHGGALVDAGVRRRRTRDHSR